MSNLIFPSTLPGVTIDVHREPVFDTHVQKSISGKELRFVYSTFPLYRYTLNFELLRAGASYLEFQKLFGFYTRHFGQYDSFLFQDPEDNAVTAHAFGVGDGGVTDFQLQRTLVASTDLSTPANRAYWTRTGDGYEPVFDLNGTASIYKNAVLLTLTTDYTISASGLVHFVVTPSVGDILTWTGGYYRRVRFEADSLGADRIVQSFWSAKSVTLLSIKP